MLPLETPATAAFGLVLAAAGHTVGWPISRGGSQHLSGALASYLRSLGGEIVVNRYVESVDELPPSRAILLDMTPRQVVGIAGHRLPVGYRRRLERYRYGPGVFKLDWALDGPVPWSARECARAGTVHLGGTLEQIAESERAVWEGLHPERPFVLLAQQSLFDSTRAPEGRHTTWAYCHVPSGSTFDMTQRIEGQVERFAPGFRDRILARNAMGLLRFRSTTPIMWGATSMVECRTSASYSPARPSAYPRTQRRTKGSTYARHRHRLAAESMECAAISPRERPCLGPYDCRPKVPLRPDSSPVAQNDIYVTGL